MDFNPGDLELLYNDPNSRIFLDLISLAEGTYDQKNGGYNTFFGSGQFEGLDRHPNVLHTAYGVSSTAAGRYQYLNRTWADLASKYGFQDFGTRSQDLGALGLIKLNRPDALDDIREGRHAAAAAKLRPIWEGFKGFDVDRGLRRLRERPADYSQESLDAALDRSSRGYPSGTTLDPDGEPLSDLGQALAGNPMANPMDAAIGSLPAHQAFAAPGMDNDSLPQALADPAYRPSSLAAPAMVVQPGGGQALAVPETPDDVAVLRRLGDFPAEVSGRALAVRQALLGRREDETRRAAGPLPDINDLDLMNLIDSIKD
jgi:muramidase (phage lysozyme)